MEKKVPFFDPLAATKALRAIGNPITQLAAKVIVHFAMRPKREKVDVTPEQWGLDYKDVSIPTTDGINLAGWVVRSKAMKDTKDPVMAAIVLHGYGKSRKQMSTITQFLAESGYTVIAYDARAHRNSGGKRTSIGGKSEVDDLGMVDQFARDQGLQPELLYGISMGAVTATQQAGKLEGIKLAILDSAYAQFSFLLEKNFSSWTKLPRFLEPFLKKPVIEEAKRQGIDPEKISPIKEIQDANFPPTVILHSTNDPKTPFEHAEALFEKASNPNTHRYDFDAEGHARLMEGFPTDHPQANDPDFREPFRQFPRKYLAALGENMVRYAGANRKDIEAAIQTATGQKAEITVIPSTGKTVKVIQREGR